MAFTAQDLAAIDAAISSGELTIRAADGRQVTMRSVAELLQAREVVTNGIADASGSAQRM
ncbi:phage head-tail joining protein [Variovorax sp. 38R]|uniref:phage head-tail joining protein n=1 Tax=Variovorax sp. 38R TaxID=2774875 RepID=UPI0017858D7E|nr:hypothetical protein [Variovorax sp. 38R]QOF80324.1 hypothetical protein IG196_08035 [Variovorax sp. 38R]